MMSDTGTSEYRQYPVDCQQVSGTLYRILCIGTLPNGGCVFAYIHIQRSRVQRPTRDRDLLMVWRY